LASTSGQIYIAVDFNQRTIYQAVGFNQRTDLYSRWLQPTDNRKVHNKALAAFVFYIVLQENSNFN
jgi:hypothetical protein